MSAWLKVPAFGTVPCSEVPLHKLKHFPPHNFRKTCFTIIFVIISFSFPWVLHFKIGDVNQITVGNKSSIGNRTIVHVSGHLQTPAPTKIGDRVLVGNNISSDLSQLYATLHAPTTLLQWAQFLSSFLCIVPDPRGDGAVLHGCTLEDDCRVEDGAVVYDGVVVGKNSVVAPGAVVPSGKILPPGTVSLSPDLLYREKNLFVVLLRLVIVAIVVYGS